MNLSPLKYKRYTWPVNPSRYSMKYEKNTAIHHYLYTNINEVDDMGNKPREVSGEGEFVGEGAYEEFQKLASIFYSKGPGALIHPIWQIQEAVFINLELEQEPTPNYVKYSFRFIEHTPGVKVQEVKKTSNNNDGEVKSRTKLSPKIHTIKSGDSMWAIARSNNLDLKQLIDKNPQIKNPNLIYPGNKINL